MSAHLGNGFESLLVGLVGLGGEQKYRSQPTFSSAKAEFLGMCRLIPFWLQLWANESLCHFQAVSMISFSHCHMSVFSLS